MGRRYLSFASNLYHKAGGNSDGLDALQLAVVLPVPQIEAEQHAVRGVIKYGDSSTETVSFEGMLCMLGSEPWKCALVPPELRDEAAMVAAATNVGDTEKASVMPSLRDCPPHLLDRYLQELFHIADANKNGVLEKDEFLNMFSLSGCHNLSQPCS